MRAASSYACLLALTSAACSGDDPAAGAGGSASAGAGPGSGGATTEASTAASTATLTGGGDASTGSSDGSTGGAGAGGCAPIGSEAVVVASAAASGEAILVVEAASDGPTDWAEAGREAVVLEVRGDGDLVGHLVLHEGARPSTYSMTLGALAEGESVRVRVSDLSASGAAPGACLSKVEVRAVSTLPDPEGALHAPIFHWPVKKRFDDLPLLVGWSKKKKKYEAVFTNENGGTPVLCGGGAEGLAAEIARWGRALDIEGVYDRSGPDPKWKRCTGTAPFSLVKPRMSGDHPHFYFGDGHNGLYEDRGGYGKTCGVSKDRKSDGDLEGWNVDNPGNYAAQDAPFTIVLRPVPVDLDAIGYAEFSGRREALVDRFAPHLYRVAGDEVAREGKIDGSWTFPFDRYAYVDVRAADVSGHGDDECSITSSGGFRLRLVTGSGKKHDGPKITKDFFSGGENWKRVAIPLPAPLQASDVAAVEFDAYDEDGIYWLELGDVFIPREGANGAVTLDYANQAPVPVGVYVDDDSSGCSGGVNAGGPGGASYPCSGSAFVEKL